MPLAIWLVISASGGTRHPREKLGEWQGSTCLGYGASGGKKDKAREKIGLRVTRLQNRKQARSTVHLATDERHPSVTVSEDSNRALEERTVCEF